MNSVKLYGTASATANAVANIQIPSRARIRGVQVAAYANVITDDAVLNLELSRASASEIAVNGAQQCIVQVALFNNFVTSGMVQSGINQFFPVDVEVIQGQLLYMHCQITGTLTFFGNFVIWYG